MEIPSEVSVEMRGHKIWVKGKEGEVEKEIKGPVEVMVEKENIIVRGKNTAITNTWKSIIGSLIKGVQKKYERRLKMLHAHFPFTIEVKGEKAIIKNFLGEKKPRTAKIVKGVEVIVKGKEVIVKGCDKQAVGQTVANLKQALKIKHKDPRIFQDGLYEVL